MKTATLAIGCLFASLSVHAVGITGQGTWEVSLQARDLDGNMATIEAYYDTALGITWLADANAAAGTAFDGGGSPTDGRMTWSNANAWAASLSLGGFAEWVRCCVILSASLMRLLWLSALYQSAYSANITIRVTLACSDQSSPLKGWLGKSSMSVEFISNCSFGGGRISR